MEIMFSVFIVCSVLICSTYRVLCEVKFYSALGKLPCTLATVQYRFRHVQTLVDITSNTFFRCIAIFRTHCRIADICVSCR
jgi:hypothetical protein